MIRKLVLFAIVLNFIIVVSSDVLGNSTDLPGHHVELPKTVQLIENIPATSYEYHIVPRDEYIINDHETKDISITDCILHPITALINVGSITTSVITWLFAKFGPIILGMSLVIGYCGFTPYCTLTIEKPIPSEIISNIPYLDDIEYYVKKAYKKYHDLQNKLFT